MFSTLLGSTSAHTAYLRPETAQGLILNYKRLLDYNRNQMPFGAATVGRAFRNEISPRGGLVRSREFTMAEIEYFCRPDDKRHAGFVHVSGMVLPLLHHSSDAVVNMPVGEAVETALIPHETLGYFLARTHHFLQSLGIHPDMIRFRQHHPAERAHYAQDCWDAEIYIRSMDQWVECMGCADRGDYDLRAHSKQLAVETEHVLETPRLEKKLVFELNKKELGSRLRNELPDLEKAVAALSQSDLNDLQKLQEVNGECSIEYTNKRGEPKFVMLNAQLLKLKHVRELIHGKLSLWQCSHFDS
jgi:glycyl-tRNA synthetase